MAAAARSLVCGLACVGLVGCGARAASNGDASFPPGRRSFDVVASLTTTDPGQQRLPGLPSTSAFSLTVDPEAGVLIVGGGGSAQVVPAMRDGDALRATMPVHVSFALQSPCAQGLSGIDYDSFVVSASGEVLTGRAVGMGSFTEGDVLFNLSLSATLTGGPDVTPPYLTSGGGAPNLFDVFAVLPSEPLPATSMARLVASDGSHVDLFPVLSDGDVKVVTMFQKPDVTLHPGGGYEVAVDGLVDFAGLSGAAEAPLRVATFPAAPLIPTDGFESATGDVLGGAALVRAGTLPPIDGAVSVYLGEPGAPTLAGGASPPTAFLVRIPRQASDTKVRFSYRVVSATFPAAFLGSVHVGSVDGPPSHSDPLAMAENATPLTGAPTNNVVISASAVAVEEIALADASASDLVVSIEVPVSICGVGATGVGLLVDDLRTE